MLLKSYEDGNTTFKITIESTSKNINEEQQALYRAFIVKASEHFGNEYREMEEILISFHPIVIDDTGAKTKLPLLKWNSNHLNLFINKSTAFLAEYGFNF